MIWDTPTPPKPDLRRFVSDEASIHQRIRCVPLDQRVTGLSVFCTGGRMYGIHVHRNCSSAAHVYSGLPHRLQHRIVWLYFPFGPKEEVVAMQICHTQPPRPSYKFIVSVLILPLLATCR